MGVGAGVHHRLLALGARPRGAAPERGAGAVRGRSRQAMAGVTAGRPS
jgi:hypothetical protein